MQRRPERRRHDDRHDQQRQRLHHLEDALGDQVEPAEQIARQQPERDPDGRAEQHRADADRERDARAVDDAAVDVAAHEVAAEPVRRARPRQRRGGIGRQRIVDRDVGRERGGEHEQKHDHRADRAQRVAPDEEAHRAPAGADMGAGGESSALKSIVLTDRSPGRAGLPVRLR